MPIGAITDQIDVPQLVLAAFFVFFFFLLVHLRREDRREGYPLQDPLHHGLPDEGVFDSKTFKMMDGNETTAPHYFPQPPMHAERPDHTLGNRLTPTGDPLLSAVGPGTYVMRYNKPFLDSTGEPDMVPLRKAKEWSVEKGDPDPRGMTVLDARGVRVGTVTDLWADRAVRILRYLEVQLIDAPRTVLLPIYFTEVSGRRRRVRVPALFASQFNNVPVLSDPDRITAREEDQVNAYYAGGEFFNREAGRRR